MQFDGRQAIYLQIADYLADRIAEGDWPPGERAPAVRDTASALKVNVNTVLRAYSVVQDLGALENRRGLGYFVTDTAREAILRWRRDRFETLELPELFARARQLDLTPDQLHAAFTRYLEEHPQ